MGSIGSIERVQSINACIWEHANAAPEFILSDNVIGEGPEGGDSGRSVNLHIYLPSFSAARASRAERLTLAHA